MNSDSTLSPYASVSCRLVVTWVLSLSTMSTAFAADAADRAGTCAGLYQALHHGRYSKVAYDPVPVTAATARTAVITVEEIGKKISLERVQNLTALQDVVPGNGGAELLQGFVDGEKVVVKVSPIKVGAIAKRNEAMEYSIIRTAEDFRNEVAWVSRLDELGIGPKFYGSGERDGRNVIVTEHIEGHLVKFKKIVDLPKGYRPTPEVIKSIEHIADVIRREGIEPDDLQMMLTPTRAYVIDPEMFRPADMYYQIDMKFENVVTVLRLIRERIQEQAPKR